MKQTGNFAKQFEQIGNSLKNLEEKNIYYIFGGVLILIFVLDYLILMRPQLNSLYKLGPNIENLSNDISKIKEDALKLESYKKEIDQLSKELDRVRVKVNPKEEVSVVLAKISLIADNYKVKIDQIMPVFENQTKIVEGNDVVYYSLPIDIDARASYHDIGKFINQLENSDVFFKVVGFSMAYKEESNINLVKLTISTVIFEKAKKEAKK